MATPTGTRCTIDVWLQEFESWDTGIMGRMQAQEEIKKKLAAKLGVHPFLISSVSHQPSAELAKLSFVVYVQASFEQINPKYRPDSPRSKKPAATIKTPKMSFDEIARRFYAYEQTFGTNNKRKHKPVPFEVKREEKKSDIVVKRKRKINL